MNSFFYFFEVLGERVLAWIGLPPISWQPCKWITTIQFECVFLLFSPNTSHCYTIWMCLSIIELCCGPWWQVLSALVLRPPILITPRFLNRGDWCTGLDFWLRNWYKFIMGESFYCLLRSAMTSSFLLGIKIAYFDLS